MASPRIKSILHGDIFNPLLVREIRQSLRSKAFNSGIIVTAATCFIVITIGLIWASEGGAIGSTSRSGRDIFGFIYFVVWTILCVAIPVTSAQRFRAERSKGEFELFRITGISPKRIIMGKLQASLVQSLLLTFLAAPFMITCYLMRGISALDIVVMILVLFIHAVALTLAGIFIGSIKISNPFFAVVNLFYVLFLLWNYSLFGIMMAEGFDSIARELGLSGNGFLIPFAVLLVYFYWFILLFNASVAVINDDKDDTTFLLRAISLASAIFIPPIFIFVDDLRDGAIPVLYSTMAIPIIVGAMLVHGSPSVSPHRLNLMWKSKILRPFKIVMYCSRPNLRVWFSLLMLSCGIWEAAYQVIHSTTNNNPANFLLITGSMVYLWSSIGNFVFSFVGKTLPTTAKSIIACLVPSLAAIYLAKIDEVYAYIACPFTTFYGFHELEWGPMTTAIFLAAWAVLLASHIIIALGEKLPVAKKAPAT